MCKHRFFVAPQQFSDGMVRITGEDARHIRVVLRLRPGDEIGVLDGSGKEYRCVLESVRREEAIACVRDWVEPNGEPEVHVTVVQSLAKGNKIEQVIQHGTEIGVSRFVLVQTKRSVVKLDGERERARVNRWQRIAKEAAEQAHRAIVPVVEGITSLQHALQLMDNTGILLLHPTSGALSLADWMRHSRFVHRIAVVVGPEGGLTDEEIDLCIGYSATPVSLMPRVLRTETAALVAVSQILLMAEHLVGMDHTR